MEKKILNVPLNRVEGDLEIRVEVEGTTVTNAWSEGTLYRGFEKLLRGRGALDGLVVTPRICGICNTGHLMAASYALDMIAGVTPPPDAVRIRNLALMVEQMQSDIRHAFLLFAPDFVVETYKNTPLFAEAEQRYAPLKGETALQVIIESKKILEILAILGGQWPHSSYSVPGGVTSVPSTAEIIQCRQIFNRYRQWYERRILGCSVDRWTAIQSSDDLDQWLAESESHRHSDLGFYIRYAREIGLHKLGHGSGHFLSYGSCPLPVDTAVSTRTSGQHLIPAGFARGTDIALFDQDKISEYVTYSKYEDYEGGRHPFTGETNPLLDDEQNGQKYTWAKAPRYDDVPAETGPLAEMIISRHPLFTDLMQREGPSVFLRQLARIIRTAEFLPAIDIWMNELGQSGEFYAAPHAEIREGSGYGLVHAARGALGHWVKIENGRIEHYQIITPTSWHASPRDANHIPGPWEQALIGTELKDPADTVALGHIIRSYDACLVCTVHTLSKGQTVTRKKV